MLVRFSASEPYYSRVTLGQLSSDGFRDCILPPGDRLPNGTKVKVKKESQPDEGGWVTGTIIGSKAEPATGRQAGTEKRPDEKAHRASYDIQFGECEDHDEDGAHTRNPDYRAALTYPPPPPLPLLKTISPLLDATFVACGCEA